MTTVTFNSFQPTQNYQKETVAYGCMLPLSLCAQGWQNLDFPERSWTKLNLKSDNSIIPYVFVIQRVVFGIFLSIVTAVCLIPATLGCWIKERENFPETFTESWKVKLDHPLKNRCEKLGIDQFCQKTILASQLSMNFEAKLSPRIFRNVSVIGIQPRDLPESAKVIFRPVRNTMRFFNPIINTLRAKSEQELIRELVDLTFGIEKEDIDLQLLKMIRSAHSIVFQISGNFEYAEIFINS